MTHQFNVPVALFLFKRKETTLAIIDRVRMVAPERIYLIGDGPRNEAERLVVEDARVAAEEAIDWPCIVTTNYADDNRGVFENIAMGAKWVFEREEQAIFLEDDNLPEVTFFDYCKELLERYRLDNKVLWICGTNYLGEYHPADNASYMFTKHMLPCGWASWSRKFLAYYDFDLHLLDSKDQMRRVRGQYEDKRLYRQQLAAVLAEKRRRDAGERFDSWDFHMAWSIRAHDALGVSPAYNQIKNIGADVHSIHGGTSTDLEMTRRFVGVATQPMPSTMTHPDKMTIDKDYERAITAVVLLPWQQRLKGSVRWWLGRILRISDEVSITATLSERARQLVRR